MFVLITQRCLQSQVIGPLGQQTKAAMALPQTQHHHVQFLFKAQVMNVHIHGPTPGNVMNTKTKKRNRSSVPSPGEQSPKSTNSDDEGLPQPEQTMNQSMPMPAYVSLVHPPWMPGGSANSTPNGAGENNNNDSGGSGHSKRLASALQEVENELNVVRRDLEEFEATKRRKKNSEIMSVEESDDHQDEFIPTSELSTSDTEVADVDFDDEGDLGDEVSVRAPSSSPQRVSAFESAQLYDFSACEKYRYIKRHKCRRIQGQVGFASSSTPRPHSGPLLRKMGRFRTNGQITVCLLIYVYVTSSQCILVTMMFVFSNVFKGCLFNYVYRIYFTMRS